MNKKATLEVVSDYHMTKNNMENSQFYEWLFFYNPYEKLWYAFKREHYNLFFNDRESSKYLRSDSVEDLTDIIILLDE